MTRNTVRRRSVLAATLAIACTAVTACGGTSTNSGSTPSGSTSGASSAAGPITLSIWATGTDSEQAALQAAVTGFNASHPGVTAKLRILPGDNYTSTVQSTPIDQLPDVLQMDGPTVGSYVYNKKIIPLTGVVAQQTIDNATPGSIAEGTSGGKLFALAQFDSALGLFGNKKLLDAAGVKYPTSIDTAWTAPQFLDALKTLAAKSPSGKALDIHEDYGLSGEWGTYAFSPLLWSSGGNLVKNDKATGVLDSAATVSVFDAMKSWKPYVDPNADGKAFTSGRVALGWGGHWMYPDYSKALGADLVDLPLPNMGTGARTGAGSWTWGVGAGTKNASAAGAFIDYLLSDQNVKAMTDANGAPAATKSAFAKQALYQSGGQLALWGEQLASACTSDAATPGCVATFRPVTAGYPVITAKFAGALQAIWGGADVQKTLTTAAQSIDQAFSDNNNYQ